MADAEDCHLTIFRGAYQIFGDNADCVGFPISALERQELFINQAVVTPALEILWEFFRYGKITWHGAFINLRAGSMRPYLVKETS